MCKQRKKDLNRRKSLEKLAVDLIRPFIEIRAQKIVENDFRGISTDIQESIRKVGVELPKKESSKEAPKAVIQRCSACPRQKDKKSRVSCARCDEFVCNDHSKSLCNDYIIDYVMVVITRYMQSTMKKKEQLGRITYENNKFYTFDRNIYIFDRN